MIVRKMDGGYSVLVATPHNIFWCMENENIDYYFSTPTVYVKLLNREHIERALDAVAREHACRRDSAARSG